jgi:hypothetical protein
VDAAASALLLRVLQVSAAANAAFAAAAVSSGDDDDDDPEEAAARQQTADAAAPRTVRRSTLGILILTDFHLRTTGEDRGGEGERIPLSTTTTLTQRSRGRKEAGGGSLGCPRSLARCNDRCLCCCCFCCVCCVCCWCCCWCSLLRLAACVGSSRSVCASLILLSNKARGACEMCLQCSRAGTGKHPLASSFEISRLSFRVLYPAASMPLPK